MASFFADDETTNTNSFFNSLGNENQSFFGTAPGVVGGDASWNQGRGIIGTATGWLGNWARGFKDIATGIGDIVGVVGHDLAVGAAKVIPGTQSIEEGGFFTDDVLAGLPGAILGDYQNRYGGVSNIARGLYENPLSYLNDVLLVAGGASALAKAGRVGVLSNLPKIVPESSALKILGPGQMQLGSTVLKPDVTEALRLSTNPAVRGIQQTAYKMASVSPEALSFSGMDILGAERALLTVTHAQKLGIRILRPGASRFVAGKWTGKLLTTGRAQISDLSKQQVAELTVMKEAFDIKDSEMPELFEVIQGGAIPETMGPVGAPVDALPKIFDEMPVVTSQLDPVAVEKLVDKYGENVSNIGTTPHGAGGNRIGVPVADMNDAARIAEEALQTVGATPFARRNYFDMDDYAWDGYHVSGVMPDGKGIIEISVGTPELLADQAAVGRMLDRLDGTYREVAETQAALSKLWSRHPDYMSTANRLASLQEEYFAGDAFARAVFNGPRQQYWASKLGIPVDKKIAFANRIKPWVYDNIIEPWMQYDDGNFSTLMNRAYGPQRVTAFYHKIENWRSPLRSIIANTRSGAEAAPLLKQFLYDQGIPSALVDLVVGQYPWRRDFAGAAERLIKRARREMYDTMVIEGGRGLEYNFPEFDWRIMHADRIFSNLPIPMYLPHFAKKPSEYMTWTGGKVLSKKPPTMTKAWTGSLYEQGRVVTDPVDIYSRAGALMINHEESIALVEKLVNRYGQEMTRSEVAAAVARGESSSMVLIAPDQIRRQLRARNQIMSDTLNGVGEGKTLTEATTEAVTNFSIKAFEDGLNSMGDSRVFAMPKVVASKMQQELSVQLGNKMRIYFDGPMNLWKASVLSLSPRWVINNFFGNAIFIGLENPGALRHAISQLSRRNARVMELLLGPETMEGIESGFFRNIVTTTSSRLLEAEAPNLARVSNQVRQSLPGRILSTVSGKIRRMNSLVEEAGRRGVFISALQRESMQGWVRGFHNDYQVLEKAMNNGVDAAQLDRALRAVDRTLGNFTAYGPIEQNIIRRFLVPFYGFYKHSVNVLARMPFDHPLKSSILRQITEMDALMQEDLPSYMRGSVILGQLGGEDFLLRLKNLNPLSQVSDEIPLLGTLNPIIKLGIERQLGIDTFTGDPFPVPEDIIESPFGSGNYWQIVRDGSGNIIDALPTGKPLPNLLAHLASQFPQLALIPDFERYPKSIELQLAGLAGIPLNSTDLDAVRQFQEEGRTGALTQAENIQNPGTTSGNSFFS